MSVAIDDVVNALRIGAKLAAAAGVPFASIALAIVDELPALFRLARDAADGHGVDDEALAAIAKRLPVETKLDADLRELDRLRAVARRGA